jgi:uncharacterized protein (DUF983 family)
MAEPDVPHDAGARRNAFAAIMARRCQRCRVGPVFQSTWVMNENCPVCNLDFDRGDPGYFTGAMYVSYAMAIPLIMLLTLVGHLIVPSWSLFRLVVLAMVACLPLVPWIWQYSRVIWISFDRYFDPDDDDGQDSDSTSTTDFQ